MRRNVRAGFRFVPINRKVIAPPIALGDLDISRPNAGGSVSGFVDVTWTAETPICIGRETGVGNTVESIKLGGSYCLPGSSLRGMVRSVLEIATFSHLGRINDKHHHGSRNYEKKSMPARHHHSPPDLRAGWLTFDGTQWKLTKAAMGAVGYRLVHFRDIVTKLGADLTVDQWRELTMPQKRARLREAGLHNEQKLLIGETLQGGIPTAAYAIGGRSPNEDLIVDGFLVCAGKSEIPSDNPVRAKKYEALFGPPSRQGKNLIQLPPSFMALFNALHAYPGRNRQEPREDWRYWLCRTFTPSGKSYREALGYEHRKDDPQPPSDGGRPVSELPWGIPVFFHGDIPTAAHKIKWEAAPAQFPFFIGLSRVLRSPWAHSVGEVAQRLYQEPGAPAAKYHVPKLNEENGWDFARAIFGEVQQKEDGDASDSAALAGRVAFECAWRVQEQEPRLETHTGVLSTPRESFYPFYLAEDASHRGVSNAGIEGSYDDERTIPAGRKRYVVRSEATSLPPGNNNPATLSTIRFLPASAKFHGRIRFHNLHPVELGALLWALSFGEPGGRFRHVAGRAKAYGYEVLKADFSLRTRHLLNCPDIRKPEPYIAGFVSYMRGKLQEMGLPPFEQSEQIRKLLRLADPACGAAAAARGELGAGEIEEYTDWKKDFACDRKSRRTFLPDV